jgi:hypothetical protein
MLHTVSLFADPYVSPRTISVAATDGGCRSTVLQRKYQQNGHRADNEHRDKDTTRESFPSGIASGSKYPESSQPPKNANVTAEIPVTIDTVLDSVRAVCPIQRLISSIDSPTSERRCISSLVRRRL